MFGAPFGAQQQPNPSPFGTRPAAPFGSALNTSTTAPQPSPFSWGSASTTAVPSTSATTPATTQPAPTLANPAASTSIPAAIATPTPPTLNVPSTTATSISGLSTSNLFSQKPAATTAPTQPAASTLGSGAAAPNAPFVLNGAAKFNDLPGPIQDLLNDTEALIQGGLNASKDLKGRKLGDAIVTNTATSRQIFHDLTSSSNTLQADDLFAKNLREKVDQAVQDVIVCSQIIEGFRESGIQHPNLKTNAQYPLEFFHRLADQMQERLARYKAIVDQLERKLTFSFQAQQSPQAITTTLQSQHASFIALAARVAEVEASMDEVKQQFSTLYKARTGSALDPFSRPSST
ncbi:hypothetical protein CPB86DRAFT_790205 [Serendipita vermifera]|nr:hypothetical protein CPB86DRAFT_790205 [Serendipita vermifera]